VDIGGSGGFNSAVAIISISNLHDDIHQKLSQDNECREVSTCSNNGTNSVLIGGSSTSLPDEGETPSSRMLDVNVNQDLRQDHHCEVGSACSSTASNSANILDNNNLEDNTPSSALRASSVQSISSEGNDDSSSRVTLHQLGEQQDKCSFSSSCADSSSNSVTVVVGDYDGDKKSRSTN
jgi:hypothetical protein